MRTLNNTGITVPGGFKFYCEETKQWIPSRGSMPGYTDFIYAVKQHYIANNIPVGLQFAEKIQDQVCAGLDGDWCQEFGYPVAPQGERTFTVEGVVQGSHKLAQRMIQSKVRRVSPETAVERATICIECPFNQGPEGCSSCNQDSINRAAEAVEGALLVKDSRLRSCKILKFSLKALVNVPADIVRESAAQFQLDSLPPKCWLNVLV
jgi:hypothetical protein